MLQLELKFSQSDSHERWKVSRKYMFIPNSIEVRSSNVFPSFSFSLTFDLTKDLQTISLQWWKLLLSHIQENGTVVEPFLTFGQQSTNASTEESTGRKRQRMENPVRVYLGIILCQRKFLWKSQEWNIEHFGQQTTTLRS